MFELIISNLLLIFSFKLSIEIFNAFYSITDKLLEIYFLQRLLLEKEKTNMTIKFRK